MAGWTDAYADRQTENIMLAAYLSGGGEVDYTEKYIISLTQI